MACGCPSHAANTTAIFAWVGPAGSRRRLHMSVAQLGRRTIRSRAKPGGSRRANKKHGGPSHSQETDCDQRGLHPPIGSVGDVYDHAACIRITVFQKGHTQPSPMPNTPSTGGSTRTTPESSRVLLETGRPSGSSKPTSLPTSVSRNPHGSGRKPRALQSRVSASAVLRRCRPP